MDRDYSRLSGTVFERQKTRDLKVLVVGAGALGNEIIKNLALLGAGNLFIVDSDRIEPSNLTRSILFCTPDIGEHIHNGEPKASLAAQRAREINNDIHTEAFVGEIADLGLGKLKQFDVVFSALDNEMARLELSWACVSTDRVLVDGGLGFRNYSSGLVSLYPGVRGPCYACRKNRERRSLLLTTLNGMKLPCAERELEADENGVVITTPLMASVIAAIQVEEGLRAVLEHGQSSSEGYSLEVTLHPRPRLARFSFTRSTACPLHDLAVEAYTWEHDSATTTVADLIDFLEHRQNAKAALTLRWPLVISAHCKACGANWSPVVRAARFRRLGQCINCRSKDVEEGEPLSEIARESEWAGKTLLELGLPRSHIHEFVMDDNEQKHLTWVEVRD